MKFKHLAEAHVASSAVARFEFPDIDGYPWLEVRPAGESNRPFTNASLKQPDRQRLLRSRMTADEIARARARSGLLYAAPILPGLGGGWLDAESGAEVAMPLAVEDRIALLRQLPSDLYDRLRVFCNDLTNFRG